MEIEKIINEVKKRGGGTYKVDDTLNIVPTTHKTGFYVAIKDTEEIHDALTPDKITSFLERNKKIVDGSYLGLWLDPRVDKYFIELTQFYSDKTTARAMMQAHEQAYVFDIANQASVRYLEMF